jgi:hypothetical protein
VKGTLLEGSPSRSDGCVVVDVVELDELVGPKALGWPGRRRRDEKARIAKKAKKTTMKSQEP